MNYQLANPQPQMQAQPQYVAGGAPVYANAPAVQAYPVKSY